MEEQITNLKNMIENAKKENDLVLVEYLTKALNHIIEKQKTQEDIKLKSQENVNQEENTKAEEKKEVFIENKQEEKEEKKEKDDTNIVRQMKGEVSTLNKYSTGNIELESEYMGVKVNSSNLSLAISLDHILVTLALDDVTKEKKSIVELYKVLKEFNKPEDIQDISNFLNSISSISTVGKTASEAINSLLLNNDLENNSELNEALNNSYDAEHEKLTKNISILDMEFDEMHNKRTKDPDEYRDMLLAYQQKLRKLEELYDETYNKVDPKKSSDLLSEINQMKTKITNIKDYIKRLDELTKGMDSKFNI